mmetsp:Transcript_76429/g.140543  ORF Transcript_76429/g.140543 Transcript_76429/m.140543 type:complete len:85 (-) Transcript_76429:192-446(-)
MTLQLSTTARAILFEQDIMNAKKLFNFKQVSWRTTSSELGRVSPLSSCDCRSRHAQQCLCELLRLCSDLCRSPLHVCPEVVHCA